VAFILDTPNDRVSAVFMTGVLLSLAGQRPVATLLSKRGCRDCG
jgi:hypothetical protein